MKKKIKDLTFFDLNEICLKADICDKCPLHIPSKQFGYDLCIVAQLNHTLLPEWAEIIEQEVEI